ncbi:MAG TPA: hypothetical protein VFX21_01540 [Acidimicrobiia bacterium]|nr:hypothetical protein [Acidimicrobiia bacterium]
MADWVTISSLATAGGTLVLAGATFSAVRSAHASTRVTERALLASIRPLLVPTRLEDPMEKIGFLDEHWIRAEGGRAVLEVTPQVIYMGFGLRNVGSGLAVLDRWDLHAEVDGATPLRDASDFRRLSRDLYIAGGDQGFWQGALRDPDDPAFAAMRQAIEARSRVSVDVLYGDHEGGQRTVTRFALWPAGDDSWLTTTTRHWNLDQSAPRGDD